MKIAFFVSSFPTLSETFIANQVIALQKSGHLVHIYAQQKPVESIVHQMVLNANLSAITFYPGDLPPARWQRMLALCKKSVQHIFSKTNKVLFKAIFRNASSLSVYNLIPFFDKPPYDVLHAHFGINGKYVTQLRTLGLYPNAKFITTFHGYDLSDEYAANNYYKDLFNACKCFTVSTNYSRQGLVKLGCEESKINVLPAGLDTQYFTRKIRRCENEVINLLFIGRLIRLKGPDLFVEICKILKDKNGFSFSATIVGDGTLLEEIEKLIREYGLAGIVILEGSKTSDEIISLLEKADLFVFPATIDNGLAEAQGLVIQEAQAMQLPVITSNAGGIAEGVIDKVTGYVLPQNDLKAFAGTIEILAADFSLRKRMGEAGRKFVVDKYDSAKLNDQLLQLYQN